MRLRCSQAAGLLCSHACAAGLLPVTQGPTGSLDKACRGEEAHTAAAGPLMVASRTFATLQATALPGPDRDRAEARAGVALSPGVRRMHTQGGSQVAEIGRCRDQAPEYLLRINMRAAWYAGARPRCTIIGPEPLVLQGKLGRERRTDRLCRSRPRHDGRSRHADGSLPRGTSAWILVMFVVDAQDINRRQVR